MSFLKSSLLALGFASLLATTPAYALNPRSFVKSTGSDSNPCTLAAPCRTFQQAVNVTAPNGEIDVLDTAGYGTMVITSPITVINQAGLAGVQQTAAGGIGISINTTGPVELIGLTIQGAGTGGTGIQSTGTGKLVIRNCLITGFTTAGIAYKPPAASTLVVTETTLEGIQGIGINVAPSALSSTDVVQVSIGSVVTAFNQTAGIQVNGDGSNATAFIGVTIHDGAISHSQTGINVQSSGAITNVFMRGETVQGNTVGITMSGSAINGLLLTLGANSIVDNHATANITGGTLKSFGDNYGVDNAGSLPSTTPISKF